MVCGWLLCLLCQPALGQTLSPQRLLGQYQQFIWTDQHGLPQNGISTVVQTPDGYLWLATAEGVVRFDGVRFTAFDTANTPELKSNNIAALLVTRDGALWACYGNGLTRYQGGRFTYYGAAQGLPDSRAARLFEDRVGNLWIGMDGGGVNVFRDGRFTAYTVKDGLPDGRIRAFAEDAEGGLWVGTLGGLARLKDGKFTSYPTRDDARVEPVNALCFTRAGVLWAGTDNGVSRLVAGRFSRAGLPAELQRHRVSAIAEDRDGNLWLGAQGDGLYRFKDGRFEVCAERDGLVNDDLQSIFFAANGDLWLGTSGSGLALLKEGRFSVYTVPDGLPDEITLSLRSDGAGQLWVNTRGGLSRFEGGRFNAVTARDGLPAGSGRALATDRAGNLLVTAPGQVLRFKDGRFSPYASKAGLAASQILEDRAGRLWIGTRFDGLLRFHNGEFTAVTTQEGLAENYITALYEDRAGNLWVGTGSGVSRVSDGRVTTWAHKDGYPGRHILAFYEDRAGQVWIGTDGNGLLRFKDGRFKAVTVKDGLYDNLAFQILEDDHGNLWMSGNKGIYRASLKELTDFADGRSKAVTSFAYGAVDGMLSRECNGASPGGWKTSDGRLWFPTIKGLVAVNPQKLDTTPPRVIIEQVTLDGVAWPAGETVRLRPGQERLEVQYTALSWNRPQQLRFKYQLAGLDDTWSDAGTRRTAYFQHLRPGAYTFRVSADNGEGVWNATGASFNLVVVPAFYRTGWFLTLLLAGGMGLVLFGYKLRVRQLERARAAQEEFAHRLLVTQEEERRRLAVELHDGLGQSLVIIKNRALLSLSKPDDHERALAQMEEISEATSAALQEIRELATSLHPYQIDRLGLVSALETMIERVAASSEIKFRHELDAVDGLLSKEAQMHLYRIVQESLSNIVKHAAATEVTIRLKCEADALRLLIQDNGRGFNVETIAAGKQGLGLTGIAERAKVLGAKLEFDSAPGQGTTLLLTIELKRAEHEQRNTGRDRG